MTATASASDFARNFGRYRDLAAAERVVEVSSNGRSIGAFLSQAEYEHYLDLRRRHIRVVTPDNVTDDLLEDLARARFGAEPE